MNFHPNTTLDNPQHNNSTPPPTQTERFYYNMFNNNNNNRQSYLPNFSYSPRGISSQTVHQSHPGFFPNDQQSQQHFTCEPSRQNQHNFTNLWGPEIHKEASIPIDKISGPLSTKNYKFPEQNSLMNFHNPHNLHHSNFTLSGSPNIQKGQTTETQGISSVNANQENLEDLLKDTSDNFISEYKWDPCDDDFLLELAYTLKFDWTKVARAFSNPEVSAKMLKDRYRKLHSVSLGNKARFSNEEDAKILKYYQVYGTKWAVIASMLPGRTSLAVKNRFYSSVRNQIRKSISDETPPSVSPLRPASLTFPNIPQMRSSSFCTETTSIECKEADPALISNSISQRATDAHTLQSFDCDSFFDFQSLHYQIDEPTNGENLENAMETEHKNDMILENEDPTQKNKESEEPPKTEPDQDQMALENKHEETSDNETSSKKKKTRRELINEIDEMLLLSYVEREKFKERILENPDLMVKELNERVNSVMLLCQEVQQELGKISQKMVKTDTEE